MNFEEVMDAARGNMGPYCKVCPVCDGRACKNQMPGPGPRVWETMRSAIIRNGRRSE